MLNGSKLAYLCQMFTTYTCRRQWNIRRFANRAVFVLVLLAQSLLSNAQHNNRSNYQLLWRINGPGMQEPSYLFGTMHLKDSRVFEFSDSVLMALRNTRSFAMEVDMDSIMTFMLSPGGPLLDTVNHMRRLLNADEYHYVDSLVQKKTGAPLDKLNLKRLWFIEKLLIDEEEALNKNAGPAQQPEHIFLDAWFHQKATGLGKPVHSLEKLQNQLGIFSADATEVQKEVFLWSIGYSKDTARIEADEEILDRRVAFLDALVNLYYDGDLQEITNVVSSWENDGEDLHLESRNHEMAGNLAGLMGKGSVFAAVGVAHLPGKNGMLSLLKNKGFTVTPVAATFTGVTKRERKRLDSLKGYALNRIAEGYSVVLPGNPVSYPLPNMNRNMYTGGNNDEVGFAFCMDIPQLAADRKELVNAMINNMATQGNAELQRSYPVTYRNMPGTEAVMRQQKMLFYLRVFIHNNRVFLFMHTGSAADSSSRKDFFQSVRFYDIVRPVTKYDTVSRPQLGFSAILPSDASRMFLGSDTERPEEAYTALDNANHISYVFRTVKMQKGYYNTSDKALLNGLQTVLVKQDSTMHAVDSVVTNLDGLPRYQYTYRHGNGYTSRLHFIPRGNLAYCLFCTYDDAHTDSSYWQRFLGSLHLLPLHAKAPAVPFVTEDGSFTVAGPERFTGNPLEHGYGSQVEKGHIYSAMDSASYSMYIIEENKYAQYYHIEPDSLVKPFVHPSDSTFKETGHRQYANGNMKVYETELKGLENGLRWYRKAVVAGHTVYCLSAILPEELASAKLAAQFFTSFRPGAKEQADTLRLQQKKLHALLNDLQSSDTAVFRRADDYLSRLVLDSTDVGPVLTALGKPFPADTGSTYAKVKLLYRLDKNAGNDVLKTAENLFEVTADVDQRRNILRYINGLATDSAVRVFLRLAPQMPVTAAPGYNTFSYTFRRDSLFYRYMPGMIATAARSESFLQAFTAFTYSDSIWLTPKFGQYKLESLIPGIERTFKKKLQEWKSKRNDEDSSWMWQSSVLITGYVLALPGVPSTVEGSFRELLADSVISLRALGARGLISRGIKVNDKTLKSILADYEMAYSFISTLNDQKQLSHIRHLLNQELISRSYVTSYLTDEYGVTDIRQVSRIKVQHGKKPAEWLTLYRYKADEEEEWEYILNGPQPLDASKLNFEPALLEWVEKDVAADEAKLQAEAQRIYESHLKEGRE